MQSYSFFGTNVNFATFFSFLIFFLIPRHIFKKKIISDMLVYVKGAKCVGIEAVPAKPAEPLFVGIYTIDGKQVTAPVKGINIVNGKKVWIK